MLFTLTPPEQGQERATGGAGLQPRDLVTLTVLPKASDEQACPCSVLKHSLKGSAGVSPFLRSKTQENQPCIHLSVSSSASTTHSSPGSLSSRAALLVDGSSSAQAQLCSWSPNWFMEDWPSSRSHTCLCILSPSLNLSQDKLTLSEPSGTLRVSSGPFLWSLLPSLVTLDLLPCNSFFVLILSHCNSKPFLIPFTFVIFQTEAGKTNSHIPSLPYRRVQMTTMLTLEGFWESSATNPSFFLECDVCILDTLWPWGRNQVNFRETATLFPLIHWTSCNQPSTSRFLVMWEN